MDTRRLRYFLEVAHTGSFTGAAERLRIAQPALSKQVGILENELGLQLFVRHGRGVTLTAAGTLVRERSAAIIHQLNQLRVEVGQQIEQPRGPVALGMPPTLRDLITVPAVRELYGRFPAVRLRIVEANVVELRDLAAGGQLDVAIIPEFESLQGLDARPLARESLCVVGPLGAGLDMSRPISLRSLRDLPLILTSHPNSFRRHIERALGRAGIEIDVRLEADTLPLSLDLIRACDCYSVMPVSAIQGHLQRRALTAAPISGELVSWVIVSLHERSRSTATRALIDVLDDHCRRTVENGSWATAKNTAQRPHYGRGRDRKPGAR
jgi:LysR family nitrogen assimilation transcriptional regulator